MDNKFRAFEENENLHFDFSSSFFLISTPAVKLKLTIFAIAKQMRQFLM